MRSNEPLILHPHVRMEYLWFGEPNNIVLLTWQRRGSDWRAGRGVWEGGGSLSTHGNYRLITHNICNINFMYMYNNYALGC